MKICPVCHGGEINNKNCLKCGGSGFASSVDKKSKRKRKALELTPPSKVGSVKFVAQKRKKQKKDKDLIVDGEAHARRERIKEMDEAARVARVEDRKKELHLRQKQEAEEKRKRKLEAEERQRRRRFREADRVQEELLKRNLRPAGSQGTIIGPSKSSAKEAEKIKKAKKRKYR